MHNVKPDSGLPALTVDLLEKKGNLVDNLFADLWKQINMKSLLNSMFKFLMLFSFVAVKN